MHAARTTFLVAALLLATGLSARGQSRPNIVFFLVDDLGWSDVGCFGSSFHDTPHVDQLAREGVRFTDAYAACHVCSPTRASILTGKYPATINLTDWLSGRRDFPFQRFLNVEINQHLPHREVTLAEALKDEGYATAIFGKWHLGRKGSMPTDHGFDLHIPDAVANWRTFHGPFGLKKLDSRKGDYLTDRLTDEALKWVESQQQKPFFLYMSHFAVHDPIEGRKDLVEKYAKKLRGLPTTDSPEFILEGNPDNPDNPSQEELAELIETPAFSGHRVLPRGTVKVKQKQDNVEFAAMVEAVDQSLGRIVAKLEELGIAENTIVIFFSDNGGMAAMNVGRPDRVVADKNVDVAYATSNLPLRGAKGWLYEGGIRVPLIIKWPKAGRAGSVCPTPVSSVDFFPTLLEMTGIGGGTGSGREGVSIAPLVRGGEIPERAIYWHFPHYSNHGMQSPGGAIRLGDHKLLEYFENGTVQLFNLKDDPGEQRDLAPVEPSRAKELRAMLHAWRKKVAARMMEPNPDYDPSAYPSPARE
ncbi:MAG: sulfatase [Akkermansiaceae bacterium]|nr:sulfatase [Akkermansiaceae bacterium]